MGDEPEQAMFTATITGPGAPAGPVTFTAHTGATAVVALLGGVAVWTLTDLPSGPTTVSAAYGGSTDLVESAGAPVAHSVVTGPLAVTGLPAAVRAGEVVAVAAIGFVPGEAVEFVFPSDPVVVGTATADARGTARLGFAAPDVELGAHTLRATGAVSQLVAQARRTA